MMEGGGSDGGGREWCGVMERGNSPRLIVACDCSSLPMSARCSHAAIVVMGLFSWVVTFVRGQWSSFVGACLCSWPVLLLVGCGGGLLVSGGGGSS